MSDPTLLYCVGATKAGTSWLYRHLHDHPECSLRAVKEAHYWDTFDADARASQVANYSQRLRELHDLRAQAETAGRGWQVRNVDRRIADMTGLIATLDGDRGGDLGYAAWLMQDIGDKRLVADMTPGYALLPTAMLRRMADLTSASRFIYLIRDPIDRLWSHIRMQARRQGQSHEDYSEKSNNILWRVLNAGQETHLLDRGDYRATVTRLRDVVPAGRLLVQFTEDMFAAGGIARLSAFLGISAQPAASQEAVHAGENVVMRADLRAPLAAFLKDQYDWVAQNVGPLPQRWQNNLQRASL